MPNGQRLVTNPGPIWVIASSQATMNGPDLEAVSPFPDQDRLAGFRIPQRGIFAAAHAFLEPAVTGRGLIDAITMQRAR
jgi:hypothetical protein